METNLYLRQQFNNKIRPLFIKDKCEYCGEKENLELHHDDKHFVELINDTLELLGVEYKNDSNDYTSKELEMISLIMLGKQVKGKNVTVCQKCHDEIHSEVGIKHILKIKEKEQKSEEYVNSVLVPFLNSILNKKLYSEEQEELTSILTNPSLSTNNTIDYRTKRISYTNLHSIICNQLNLPYSISKPKQETKSINRGKRYIVITNSKENNV